MGSSDAADAKGTRMKAEVKELVPTTPVRRFNLRQFGFVGHVSETAKADIERNASRASRVVSTSTRFAFR
jgi:hypothetical protein